MLNFTHKRKSVSRLFAPVALAVILAGCATTSEQPVVATDITAAATDTAANYLIKAESSEGVESINWHILALKAFIQEGRWAQAEQQVQRLSQMNLGPVQLAEWQLARATLRYQQGQPQAALDSLNFQPWWTLSKSQYVRYHMLRAELYAQTQQPLAAARERTILDQYLAPEQKAANWQQLWQDLALYNNNQLQTIALGDDESVLRGWVQLAVLKNTYAQRPAKLKSMVQDWLAQHPYHPANQYLPADLDAIMSLEIAQIDNVALLLPLSGRFEKSGKAVRDGFINAMLDDTGRAAETELTVYDTEAESIPSIMSKLQQTGVQLVIGPLRKEKITEFQQANQGQISLLALNEPDQSTINQGNACYFALSPEQEAEQAARHLFAEGHRYPMVLAPGNSFGQRVSDAFIKQWQQLTGNTPAQRQFSSRQQIQKEIAGVFGLTDSQARIDQMKQILGNNSLEGQPRSRRDTDAVYMIANINELTLLKPFIDVAVNPGVKPPSLYASSRSYPNRNVNTMDIRGIEFSDIPLLVNANQHFMGQFDELWPNSNNTEVRLHAFGMDAYKMITELPQMRVVDNYTTQGNTGVLSLDNQCVVQRELSWATFSGDGIEPAQ
ncbi:penicillin-binding protein activator [Photobacterium aphoticum]|uniref:Penicillin-binding protein activator LpoA n=1 Tax=Photobacterium aphoticum TaxID=754436 RepID=A0A0J1JKU9_9GAMM|nr:penicillin-binding protein activator [Photobacterium aphoticum]KLV02677.1 penicillin-binding protein [Photobacterium aphoticum]PSU55352.1 penicillin-binding protein activator [Photobacterium aphoticum]GHA54178.1 penicillin-binding protein activator LpoA [Photobacterium aphoticum]